MNREMDLARRREYLEAVLESAPDAIVTLDSDHRIIDWNSGAVELFGYTKEEVAGSNIDDLITGPEVNSEAKYYTVTVLSGEKIPPVETVRYRKDGTPVNVLMAGAPIIVEGELMGVIGVYTDITERKLYEMELLKSRRLESVGTLAGGIAHDFNNLLSGIFGNISLVSAHIPENNPARPYLEAVEKAMGHAVGLTHQLLTFARGSHPVLEPLDTVSVLRDSVQFNLAGSAVRPRFHLPEDIWMIRADPRQIGEVISNLVINAKESMPDGGDLHISAENITEDMAVREGLDSCIYVRIGIEDRGTGISEEHIDRIFEPFYTTREKGSGLGLAVVHSIVSKHGGRIRVRSVLGEGTTFSVYLPGLAGADCADRSRAEERFSGNSGRSAKILVMDDEDYILRVAASMLETMGHRTDTAADGARAVDMYRRAMESGKGYDMVILDLTVPGEMGGMEAAREILKSDGEAVLVVSSGYSNAPIMGDYKSHGFSGVLAKPYTLREMERLMSSLVD